ncbi:MAG: cytochrome c oxidase assembly protein [Acidimicrobiales bacterium]
MSLASGVVTPSTLAGSWSFEPALLTATVLTAVIYGRGTARLGRRIAAPGRRRRDVAFYGGLAIVLAAVMSPLGALSAALFSAHMGQHLILMLVAAPLLAWSRPGAALLAGLSEGGRDLVRRAAAGGLRGAGHAVTRPLVVGVVGTLVLWAWHMPSLYEAALAYPVLHVAEHVSFLGVAVLFWAVVLGSGVRRGTPRPVALLLVLATGVQSTALGAILVFASMPLYPAHAEGAAAWDVSPLGDQQLAGALMWSPPALIYLVTIGWLFVRWFAEMDDPTPDRRLVVAGEHP